MKMSWFKFFIVTLCLSLVSMLVMGATVDLKKGGTVGFSSAFKSPVIQKVVVDASVNSFATGDTVELFNVPAKTLITKLNIAMVTAATAAYTADFGVKGATLDLFGANTPLNATAGTIKYGDGATGTTSVFIPYYTGTTAKVIQMADIVGGACSTYKAVVTIEMVDMTEDVP